jgi:hypothetical protein
MSLKDELRYIETMHTTLLETGWASTAALEEGAFTARNVLRRLSTEQLENLTQEQRERRDSLLEAYKNLSDGVDGERRRRGWFGSARELLLQLPD